MILNARIMPCVVRPLMSRIASGWTALQDDKKSDMASPLAEEWPVGIFKETSAFKEKWDFTIVVLILYSALVVPFRIGFSCRGCG